MKQRYALLFGLLLVVSLLAACQPAPPCPDCICNCPTLLPVVVTDTPDPTDVVDPTPTPTRAPFVLDLLDLPDSVVVCEVIDDRVPLRKVDHLNAAGYPVPSMFGGTDTPSRIVAKKGKLIPVFKDPVRFDSGNFFWQIEHGVVIDNHHLYATVYYAPYEPVDTDLFRLDDYHRLYVPVDRCAEVDLN